MKSDDEIAFLTHFIKKGFKPEYLHNLPTYTKTLFAAVMDDEIEEKNKYAEIQSELLKKSDGVSPVFPIHV